ncbi:predicted protein [Nematostella vectensis]|uniref:Glutamate dehydrogenase n=1 Tax=Nematostella vectensis TaxID=45351 RepID=A7T660_NEMVE|nr:predicted protein [Nematostella vectensis]|eukprot:XP_001620649.1 hypothetical protein NEMVEDRAFT_v1g222874 [Nematostella vectensis]
MRCRDTTDSTGARYLRENPKYCSQALLERIVEPERVLSFRVPWLDDKGEVQVNRGYRVEFNSSIGPYKGGLRFHPSVNLGILKFLGFEQVLKNSLTTLPMGGGKGGSNFDPKGKSDNEVMRFCQSFMLELQRHIGPDTDVPAGDIGVGGREIGFLFGQYKRIRNEFTGVLTGGSCWYSYENFPKMRLTLNAILILSPTVQRNVKRGRIKEYADKYGVEYHAGKRPWFVKCDVALPCATQNEINQSDAETLVKNGCMCVGEGANMPTEPEAIKVFQKARVLYAPGKASNAGGVAVSGLEMSQNSLRGAWTRKEVDEKLSGIMKSIHDTCVQYGTCKDGYVDYVRGANIGGFVKVADAMLQQGVV